MRNYVFSALFLALYSQIMACAPETELSSAEIESGLAQLESIETLSYEYVIEITNENGMQSIRYDVEMNRDNGDYTSIMYVDEMPVSETCRENGISYRKINGNWYEVEDIANPSYPVDIIPEEGDIETVKRSETDGNKVGCNKSRFRRTCHPWYNMMSLSDC